MSRLRTILSFVFAITILSQFSPLWAENAVPVMMWGDSAFSICETTAVNPFVKTTREDFDKILSNVVKERPSVLVFLSENFCVEDIVRHRKHLQQAMSGAKYNYVNAVEEPIDAFKELPMYNQTDVDAESISGGQLLIKPIANLDSLPEMISEIKNHGPGLLIALTGKACAYRKSERVRRQATADSTEFIFSNERVLFYASEALHLKTPDGQDTPLSDPVRVTVREDTPGSSPTLRMQFVGQKSPIVLEFNFEVKTAGYFTLDTVNYQADGETKMQKLKATSNIVFPFHFSYHCSQKTIFKDGDTELMIKNLQVEIDGKEDRFNDAYDCVGFTTIPIWTGLFVTAILAAIMIWGLSMIIDIRTMDRFDDPKGKTITISAQE